MNIKLNLEFRDIDDLIQEYSLFFKIKADLLNISVTVDK